MAHFSKGKHKPIFRWPRLQDNLLKWGEVKAAGLVAPFAAAIVFVPVTICLSQLPDFLTILPRLVAWYIASVATITVAILSLNVPGILVGSIILAAIAALCRDKTTSKFFDMIRRLVQPAYRWIVMAKSLAEQSAVMVQLSRQILAAQLVFALVYHDNFPHFTFSPLSATADSVSN